jgi:AmmeMemoRadiSam system protein A
LDTIPFTQEETAMLFRIARESIAGALAGKPEPAPTVTEPNLLVKRGVFVTLTNQGRLRGCIGHFGQDTPLYEIVAEMASAAATQDYRFMYDPVTPKEMEVMDIKISVLSDLRKIRSIDEIEIGKHGIWIRQGSRSGTYLPEVATEMGWDREEFVEHCCLEKAGLPADAYKKGAEMLVYTSQILEEPAR